MGWKNKSLITCLLLIALATSCLSMNIARAEGDPEQYESMLSIGVDRRIDFLSGGYIMINDTIIFSWNISESGLQTTSALTSYTVGLPRNYSNSLVYYSAHDAEGDLSIRVLEDNGGFQWLEISFPKPITPTNDNRTYNFTVTFILSDLIRSETGRVFRSEFPLYPSLREEIDYCNVTVVFPPDATVTQDNYPSEIFLNKTDDHKIISNFTSPLMAYANISSWVEFSSTTFGLLKFLDIKREISIDSWGRISVTDFYEISVVNIDTIKLSLPAGASEISVYDAYGQYESDKIDIFEGNESVSVKVTLNEKLRDYGGGKIAVVYALPFSRYIIRGGWQSYLMNISLTKPDEWVIERMIAIVNLPEGANFIQEGHEGLIFTRVGLFQERATAEYYRVTRYQSLNLSISYQYMILWAALRPTILASFIAAIIGLAIVAIRFTGEVKATVPTPVSSEILRKFIEAYEERMRIISEIEDLDQQSRRGKISRRHYRLQRKFLEERLSTIQKSVSELRREIESAGGRYIDMIRRLEAADADIEVAKRSIAEVEVRYARGEISAETYRRLVEEYRRKMRELETVIDGVLLSLKEEIL